jgi:hypothetical protein
MRRLPVGATGTGKTKHRVTEPDGFASRSGGGDLGLAERGDEVVRGGDGPVLSRDEP